MLKLLEVYNANHSGDQIYIFANAGGPCETQQSIANTKQEVESATKWQTITKQQIQFISIWPIGYDQHNKAAI